MKIIQKSKFLNYSPHNPIYYTVINSHSNIELSSNDISVGNIYSFIGYNLAFQLNFKLKELVFSDKSCYQKIYCGDKE